MFQHNEILRLCKNGHLYCVVCGYCQKCHDKRQLNQGLGKGVQWKMGANKKEGKFEEQATRS